MSDFLRNHILHRLATTPNETTANLASHLSDIRAQYVPSAFLEQLLAVMAAQGKISPVPSSSPTAWTLADTPQQQRQQNSMEVDDRQQLRQNAMQFDLPELDAQPWTLEGSSHGNAENARVPTLITIDDDNDDGEDDDDDDEAKVCANSMSTDPMILVIDDDNQVVTEVQPLQPPNTLSVLDYVLQGLASTDPPQGSVVDPLPFSWRRAEKMPAHETASVDADADADRGASVHAVDPLLAFSGMARSVPARGTCKTVRGEANNEGAERAGMDGMSDGDDGRTLDVIDLTMDGSDDDNNAVVMERRQVQVQQQEVRAVMPKFSTFSKFSITPAHSIPGHSGFTKPQYPQNSTKSIIPHRFFSGHNPIMSTTPTSYTKPQTNDTDTIFRFKQISTRLSFHRHKSRPRHALDPIKTNEKHSPCAISSNRIHIPHKSQLLLNASEFIVRDLTHTIFLVHNDLMHDCIPYLDTPSLPPENQAVFIVRSDFPPNGILYQTLLRSDGNFREADDHWFAFHTFRLIMDKEVAKKKIVLCSKCELDNVVSVLAKQGIWVERITSRMMMRLWAERCFDRRRDSKRISQPAPERGTGPVTWKFFAGGHPIREVDPRFAPAAGAGGTGVQFKSQARTVRKSGADGGWQLFEEQVMGAGEKHVAESLSSAAVKSGGSVGWCMNSQPYPQTSMDSGHAHEVQSSSAALESGGRTRWRRDSHLHPQTATGSGQVHRIQSSSVATESGRGVGWQTSMGSGQVQSSAAVLESGGSVGRRMDSQPHPQTAIGSDQTQEVQSSSAALESGGRARRRWDVQPHPQTATDSGQAHRVQSSSAVLESGGGVGRCMDSQPHPQTAIGSDQAHEVQSSSAALESGGGVRRRWDVQPHTQTATDSGQPHRVQSSSAALESGRGVGWQTSMGSGHVQSPSAVVESGESVGWCTDTQPHPQTAMGSSQAHEGQSSSAALESGGRVRWQTATGSDQAPRVQSSSSALELECGRDVRWQTAMGSGQADGVQSSSAVLESGGGLGWFLDSRPSSVHDGKAHDTGSSASSRPWGSIEAPSANERMDLADMWKQRDMAAALDEGGAGQNSTNPTWERR